MVNTTESHYELTIAEEDLGVFIRVYRSIKDSFHFNTRLMLLHIEDDIWEFRVLGLTTREWLEFCANVFAELPSETVDLTGETPPKTGNTAADFLNEVGFEDAGDEAEEEPEDDNDSEEGDGEPEEEEETPSEEVERKLGANPQLRKAKLVRKTGSSAVTVESD